MRAGLHSKPVLPHTQPMPFTPHKQIRRARALRREQTAAEKQLWGYLRNRRLSGFKFIRQEPVGPYIADFLCRETMLIVEVDGVTHGEDHEIAYDARRTAYLEAQGYRVHRVPNIEVHNNLDGVLNGILLELMRVAGTAR